MKPQPFPTRTSKAAIGFFLSLISILIAPAHGAVDFLILESAKPGPTLVIFAPAGGSGGAGLDAVRQLQHRKPDRGRLVLAQAEPDAESQPSAKPAGWKSEPDLTTLTNRFSDPHLLVFREDDEAHSYDKRFGGDTVAGSGEGSSAVLKALRGLKDVDGKDWQALPSSSQERKIIVTTNARVEMDAGLRPARREREFRTAAAALLSHLDMLDAVDAKPRIFPEARPGLVRVAVFDGPGALNAIGRGPAWLRARLAREADLLPELVGVPEILQGALAQADVLVVGGGFVTLQSNGLGKEGREAIVKFVQNGGGFVGICAGACLGSSGSGKWNHLELLPVEIAATYLECFTPLVWSAGPLGVARVENADMHGGPSFKLMNPDSDSITVWARFERNETSKEKGECQIKDTPAVISGIHGKGRVVLTSTHCERPPSPATIFPEMVRWSAPSVSPEGGNRDQTTTALDPFVGVVAQQQMGDNACGPCALINSLLQSKDTPSLSMLAGTDPLDKARDFARRFGAGRSVAFGELRKAYSDENGTTDRDLLAMINRMRSEQGADPLSGQYLTKAPGETQRAFTQRIKRLIEDSIATGFAPLLSVRSVKAERNDAGEYEWNGIAGHWVCIVGIEETGTADPLLVLRLADSLSGKIIGALLYNGEPRGAKVPMACEVGLDGKETWDWMQSDNCLFLSAPELTMGTNNAQWHERTYIAARFLISKPSSKGQNLSGTEPATR